MDRAVLEGDPHAVIEGMLIAARAIGSEKGFIYVRAEYPIAVDHLKNAITQAQRIEFTWKTTSLGRDLTLIWRLKWEQALSFAVKRQP